MEGASEGDAAELLQVLPEDVGVLRLNSAHWVITRDEREQAIVNARLAAKCEEAASQGAGGAGTGPMQGRPFWTGAAMGAATVFLGSLVGLRLRECNRLIGACDP